MPDREPPTQPVVLREALSSSIRYWEPRRLLYNGALILVVAGTFVAGWPDSKAALRIDTVLVLFVMAVLANVAYCAAYLPDLVLQYSSFRDVWIRARWALLLVGTLMACAVTYLSIVVLFGVAAAQAPVVAA